MSKRLLFMALLMISVAPAAHASNLAVVSAEGFLRDLDRGDFDAAYAKLDRLARANYSYSAFEDASLMRRADPEIPPSRKVVGSRQLQQSELLQRQSFRGLSTEQYTVVCFVERPKSGWGEVTHVEVTTVSGAGSGERIADFVFQSEPTRRCAY